MPTSVLLAVLAAAGLLALAPALVRRYDATERLVAERASSTARVLERRRRRRTVPGRRPINPSRIRSVTLRTPSPSSGGKLHRDAPRSTAGGHIAGPASSPAAGGTGGSTPTQSGDSARSESGFGSGPGSRAGSGSGSGSVDSGRAGARRLAGAPDHGPDERGRAGGQQGGPGGGQQGGRDGDRQPGGRGATGRLVPPPSRRGRRSTRAQSGTGGRQTRRPAARRKHTPAIYRRRRVFAALVLLNLIELVGVAAVGPGFWVSFAVTATMLGAYLVHLRNRALRDRRRRRTQAREAAWLAARQAEVRREQARRAAARREAQRRLAAQREAVRRAAMGVDRGDLPAAAGGVASVSYRRAGGLRGRPYQAGRPGPS